ncbi:MAG: hypothetical protein OEX09_05885 [Candidatus Bathyarchaeota archaeon]|nr:hypothetical protein [Candidatus Bathyarchaeota archaeon]
MIKRQGWILPAEGASLAASNTFPNVCIGTGVGLYDLTDFLFRKTSKTSNPTSSTCVT